MKEMKYMITIKSYSSQNTRSVVFAKDYNNAMSLCNTLKATMTDVHISCMDYETSETIFDFCI